MQFFRCPATVKGLKAAHGEPLATVSYFGAGRRAELYRPEPGNLGLDLFVAALRGIRSYSMLKTTVLVLSLLTYKTFILVGTITSD